MNFQSIRIVNLDSYMSAPIQGLDAVYSEFRATSISQVPILRLFGSVPTGEKICVHIHGVFPYIYIPYDGSEDANSFMYKIASNIDKTVNISLNQATSNMQHVYRITLVSGIPMYGCHTKKHQFFKIQLYNPLLVRKVTSFLMNESTLGKLYQPHEAHLSFTLQFMIDYNLHGMSNMILSKIKFRHNNKLNANIPSDLYLPLSVTKMTVCELEADCMAEDIINREEIANGNIGANPGIAALWADEQQRKRNKGLNSQIEHLLELHRTNVPPTTSHLVYKQALRERLTMFSDKKSVPAKLNASVYPAETPDDMHLINACSLESQSASSGKNSSLISTSLDETLDLTSTLNITFDGDDQRFLQVLNELENNANRSLEEDSILTQVVEEECEKEMDENELDFSISLETARTPIKHELVNQDSGEDDDDIWDTTLVPQIDGVYDEIVKKGRDMPEIEKGCSKIIEAPDTLNKFTGDTISKKYNTRSKNIFLQLNTKATCKKIKINENLKTKIQKNVNVLSGKGKLKTMARVIDKKENKLRVLLKKNQQPKFRITSNEKVKVAAMLIKKVNLLKDIILTMKGYVDPYLHLIVKYPRNCCFLYKYNSHSLPEIIKIPRKVCESSKEQDLNKFVKKQLTNWSKSKKSIRNKLKIKNINADIVDEGIYIFSKKYLSNVNNPSLSSEVSKKNNEEIRELVTILREKLNVHINFLWTSSSNYKTHYVSNENERPTNLNKFTCLKTETKEDKRKCYRYKPQEKFTSFQAQNTTDPNTEHRNPLKINNVSCTRLRRRVHFQENCTYSSPTEASKKSKKIKNCLQKKSFFSLDGTVDSDSTSDEDKPERKRKKKKSYKKHKYTELPITVDRFPEGSTSSELGDKNRDQSRESAKTEICSLSKLSFNSACEKSVKRQLFQNDMDSMLLETEVKGSLISTASKIENNDRCENRKSEDELSNSSTILDPEQEPLERSFFIAEIKTDSKELTTAEKYDKITNFRAREGCSKFATQLSQRDLKENTSPDLLTQYQPSSIENSSNSDLLTPYQQIVDGSVTEELLKDICSPGNYAVQIKSNSTQLITITPKNLPPTKADVLQSLDLYNLPHILNQIPFYSNVEDVTASVEVGLNVLKIHSKTIAQLPDFESQTNSFNIYRNSRLEQMPSNTIKGTKENVNNVLLSYCTNNYCTITPVKKAPDFKYIQNWIKQKSKKIVVKENRQERVKLHVPLSPGGKSDEEDLDLSLTLSPITSQGSTDSVKNASENSNSSVRSTSPTLTNKRKRHKTGIRKRIFSKSLKNSFFTSQESSINSGQITGVSPDCSYINKSVQNLQNARAIMEHQNLTCLVLELHIRTRGDLNPDPEYDSIQAIFYSVLHDVPEPNIKGRNFKGVIAINSLPISPEFPKYQILDGIGIDCDITYVNSEDNLLNELLKVVDYWDPDIFAGYEIEMLSWGYLIDRGSVLGINLKHLLGKTSVMNVKQRQRDEESTNELRLTGRIILDVWRLMRHEISLQSYTIESITYHILQRRLPHYSFKDLTFWWDTRTQIHRYKTAKYYITRIDTILELFDKLDFLGRTSELARLFGIQFYEVLSRGSQFRVESMMLRLAKPLNFIAVSPSVQQRAHMKAPEYIALVMEPESKLYNDPVIVLDFQSLYPSIIIAYNYCFTTCMGRVECLGKNESFEFGATQLKVSRNRIKKLLERDQLNFSPCGVAFVKKQVRDGILPRMLREILDTRLMVKNSMKENKDDKILQKVLHSRQLGLKLIANVTYGYTSANFSGRMPAVEIGDSVVSKGRETLQRALELVDSTKEWGARVVYGDTDSLFVLVPGKTKEQAFEIGEKIAKAVTNSNPDPIKLKLEKVYQPCILQTKKRYVGFMYENSDQKEPVYEAKGIETVRRDGCPSVSKMLEKCLRILFETKDVSLVKSYVLKQFNKIITGRLSIQDLTFAKEYRGADGYRPTACVPALELARKWVAVDRRKEPRRGERVPYVIVNGPPGLPLIRLVRCPTELLNDSSLKPNAIYYITRVIIPPINRCFNLIGVDVNTWFNQMPRRKTQYISNSVSPKKKSTISQYFSTSSCVCCEEQTQSGICQNCYEQPQNTILTLTEKMRIWETNNQNIVMICQTCSSSVYEVKCISLNCPVYYKRVQAGRDEQQTNVIREFLFASDFLF